MKLSNIAWYLIIAVIVIVFILIIIVNVSAVNDKATIIVLLLFIGGLLIVTTIISYFVISHGCGDFDNPKFTYQISPSLFSNNSKELRIQYGFKLYKFVIDKDVQVLASTDDIVALSNGDIYAGRYEVSEIEEICKQFNIQPSRYVNCAHRNSHVTPLKVIKP